MGEGEYLWSKSRPKGAGWVRIAVKSGGSGGWLNRLWWRAA